MPRWYNRVMQMTIAEVTHSGVPSVTGYNQGCRCPGCGIANSKKVSAYRNRLNGYGRNESESKHSTVPESVRLARQDMADIKRMIAIDPRWCSQVSEAVSGEIAALKTLIDTHNRSGRLPQLEYGSYDGTFWVGAADDTAEATVAVTPTAPVTDQAALQLPQHAPLAMPRNVASGVAPTVPSAPHRQTSSDSPSVSAPRWG